MPNKTTKSSISRAEFKRRKCMFEKIYDNPSYAVLLQWNSKYAKPEWENYTPIICLDDLIHWKFVICAFHIEELENSMKQYDRTDIIVAEYSSLDEMIEDGWCLNT